MEEEHVLRLSVSGKTGQEILHLSSTNTVKEWIHKMEDFGHAELQKTDW